MSELRGIEQGQAIAVSVEVIAAEVRLMKEDLGRRFDEQREDIRSMRGELSTNYVHHQAYHAEQKRQDDRIESVAADVLGIQTTLATQSVDIHGHIDRRFDDLLGQVKAQRGEFAQQMKEQREDFAAQLKEQQESRRWGWGTAVAIGLGFLTAATAVVIAVIGTH